MKTRQIRSAPSGVPHKPKTAIGTRAETNQSHFSIRHTPLGLESNLHGQALTNTHGVQAEATTTVLGVDTPINTSFQN